MEDKIEPLLVRHKMAKTAIACGNSKYWELVKSGEIKVVGEGPSSRAVWESVKQYVRRLLEEAHAEAA